VGEEQPQAPSSGARLRVVDRAAFEARATISRFARSRLRKHRSSAHGFCNASEFFGG